MKVIFKSSAKIFITVFLVVLALNVSRIGGTNSFFSNREKSSENSFTAGTWPENNPGIQRIQTENILAPSLEGIVEEPALEVVETTGIVDEVDDAIDAVDPVIAPKEEVLPEETLPEAPAVPEEIVSEEIIVDTVEPVEEPAATEEEPAPAIEPQS